MKYCIENHVVKHLITFSVFSKNFRKKSAKKLTVFDFKGKETKMKTYLQTFLPTLKFSFFHFCLKAN